MSASNRLRDIMAFSFYADDSERTGSKIVALGGCLGREERWPVIEEWLSDVYAKHGITYFHAKKFHATRGEFEGWDGEKKAEFCLDMFVVAGDMLECALCICVEKATMSAMKKASKKLSQKSAFGYAFDLLAWMNTSGARMPIERIPRPVKIWMESGCSNSGEFVRAFHKTQSNGDYGANLIEFGFVGKHSCKAVQLADFFAFYGRLFAEKLHEKGTSHEVSTPHALKIARHFVPHAIGIVRDAPVIKDGIPASAMQIFYSDPKMAFHGWKQPD